MKITDRLKKEMSEGVVRAILEHAEYRVTDFGIEKQIPLAHLNKPEYKALDFPDAVRLQPDFVVLARDETAKLFVEVKYRDNWCAEVLTKVQSQVEIFKQVVLVSFYPNAPNPKNFDSPSQHLRCCRLSFEDDKYEVELWDGKSRTHSWHLVSSIKDSDRLWWQMSPLKEIFDQFKDEGVHDALRAAVKSISGLFKQQAVTKPVGEAK